jgi:hypothetical protein
MKIIIFIVLGIIGLIFYVSRYTETFNQTESNITTQVNDGHTGNPSNRSKCFSCENEIMNRDNEYVRHGQKCFDCEKKKLRNKPLFEQNVEPYLNRFLQR